MRRFKSGMGKKSETISDFCRKIEKEHVTNIKDVIFR